MIGMIGDGLTLTDQYPELAAVNAMPDELRSGISPPLANPAGRGVGFFFQPLDQYLADREAAAATCPIAPSTTARPVGWDIFSHD